jgi:quercetin dioxygenase-like cupin family protein
MQVYTWADITEERINESITRQMFWGKNIMVTKWQLAPNAALPEHEHVSEQITMVHEGSVTLLFPGQTNVTLGPGQMLVIPPSVRHGVKVGPDGCVVTDLFSPIREDFIQGSAAYLTKEQPGSSGGQDPAAREARAYERLHGFLTASGIKVTLEEVKEVPLDILARYAYERQCLSLGQLRDVLGMDKQQAKALLREWKHGDDHSEASFVKSLQTRVILPWEAEAARRRPSNP